MRTTLVSQRATQWDLASGVALISALNRIYH
ncbi:hypothetical protein M5D96_011555 [Drosophila gunungcola]|uniref:Uncharacterized protein n=1 Tax=Drosophila gunungcola TaxID=103775 RepID=A0A9Q0BKA8_9MUSC|nr:hypothetical protein M5D96_011555 [Drosophila gunungcola]